MSHFESSSFPLSALSLSLPVYSVWSQTKQRSHDMEKEAVSQALISSPWWSLSSHTPHTRLLTATPAVPSVIPLPSLAQSLLLIGSFQQSWASLIAQLIKNQPAMWETWVRSLGWEDPWRRQRLPTPVLWPGEFHGLCSPWGCKEWDMSERLSLACHIQQDCLLREGWHFWPRSWNLCSPVA